jgi:hypothetical protein
MKITEHQNYFYLLFCGHMTRVLFQSRSQEASQEDGYFWLPSLHNPIFCSSAGTDQWF